MRSTVAVFAILAISSSFASAKNFVFDDEKNERVEVDKERCTSIGVGRGATVDGSTITTHNNDCQQCDFRITHVPARDWPVGSKRPIYDIHDQYPRYLEPPGEANYYGPDYVKSSTYPDTSIYNWNYSRPFAYIDQVAHTYGYTMGTYAIQNEKQVSIGESTCTGRFVAKPISEPDGKATLAMESLTQLALERCATARCAVQTMGDLAVQHGFYGGDWGEELEVAQDEAGEALTVSDPNETWMFHILPDDTGASAIWVAQRVPDDHITAVANAFVIGEIDLANKDFFLASENIFDVAVRHGLWSDTKDDRGNTATAFHFARVYGIDRHRTGFMCTRRIWRVFTLAAPSLLPIFSPFTDGMGTFGFGPDGSQPYPFSVKPDRPLSVQDVMNMNRDQFEGTPFDMTAGPGAGMFGDPIRFAPISLWQDPKNGLSYESYQQGLLFERPISLWRTAYSTVTQSRNYLPDFIGAVTWVAQYAPHHASFLPVYAAPEKTPSSLNTGTEYKLDKKSNWWAHCVTGNYLSRWYRYSIQDVRAFQRSLEQKMFASQKEVEGAALAAVAHLKGQLPLLQPASNKASDPIHSNNSPAPKSANANPPPGSPSLPAAPEFTPEPTAAPTTNPIAQAIKILQDYHEKNAAAHRDMWWDFFFQMVSRYRDLYKVNNIHTDDFSNAFRYVGVPRWWFEQVGFFGAPGTPAAGEGQPSPILPVAFPTLDSIAKYSEAYPKGIAGNASAYPYISPASFDSVTRENEKLKKALASMTPRNVASLYAIVGYIVGTLLTWVYFKYFLGGNTRHDYLPLR